MTHAHSTCRRRRQKELVEALKEADGIGTGATRDSFVPLLERRGLQNEAQRVVPLQRGATSSRSSPAAASPTSADTG
jgi:DNA topoisomerase IA